MNHNIQACQVIGIDIAKNSFAVQTLNSPQNRQNLNDSSPNHIKNLKLAANRSSN